MTKVLKIVHCKKKNYSTFCYNYLPTYYNLPIIQFYEIKPKHTINPKQSKLFQLRHFHGPFYSINIHFSNQILSSRDSIFYPDIKLAVKYLISKIVCHFYSVPVTVKGSRLIDDQTIYPTRYHFTLHHKFTKNDPCNKRLESAKL